MIKKGQKVYLKKENRPMSLNKGELYGEIIDIDNDRITIRRIDGKDILYVNDGRKSVFASWFTTKKKKE